jgi:hypothetical protein
MQMNTRSDLGLHGDGEIGHERRRRSDQTLSAFQLVLPCCFHDLCETRGTIGMSENTIGRIHAMGFEIRPPSDPTLMIERNVCLVSNESAETTDREHRRRSLGRQWRLVSYLSKYGFKSHASPLSLFIFQNSRQIKNSNIP